MKSAIYILISSIFLFCFCNSAENKKTENKKVKPKKAVQEKQLQKTDNDLKIILPNNKKNYKIEVIRKFPHDPKAYTQGLIYHDGYIYESTGQRGKSSLRKIDTSSGEIIKKSDVDAIYFAEGIDIVGDKIYMLTWNAGTCLVWDINSMSVQKTFFYKGEGWGLCYDGNSFIKTDGTSQFDIIDPGNFQIIESHHVFDGNKRIGYLNELEYVEGLVFANIYFSDEIIVFDPVSGEMQGKIDISILRSYLSPDDETDVLNGVAYNQEKGTFYLTGKFWPWFFEVKISNVD